jgi:triacylglycerol lipase
MSRTFYLLFLALFACHQSPSNTKVNPSRFGYCQRAPYPIILHHGLSGFDHLGPINYFYGVKKDLARGGILAFETEVAPYQSSAVRGKQLAARIDQILEETEACKVNIVAHSQGGLDARYMISSLGYDDRVAALVTISTPHRGSRVADAVLGYLPDQADRLLDAFARLQGVMISDLGKDPNVRASMIQLSEKYMNEEFNPQNPDAEEVAYFSVAGRSLQNSADQECEGGLWPNPVKTDAIDPLLLLTGLYLKEPNDGLVTVASAKWGAFVGCISADHYDEIGQLADALPNLASGFDHKRFYRKLAAFLRERGF